ncbi:MAG: LptE family protein [Acidobacteriota bacterium]|jgi:outer membrane lipopolysaccharide assembly protein LptE/RlpB
MHRRVRPAARPAVALILPLLLSVSLAVALAAWTGCGYSLVGRGTNIPEDVRAVYISPFDNRTQRQQLDQFVTEAIADEMVKRRRFDVVSERAGADADLSGEVVAFGLTPITFDDQGRAVEYEISLTARVRFERTGSDEVLWQNDHYLFRETYEIDTGEAGFLDREEDAIRGAAQRFAETMVSDLLEGF